MDDATQDTTKRALPFNNLHLISGLVNGYNSAWMYFLTLSFAITGYVFYQALLILPLSNILIENGYSSEQILHDSSLLFNSAALKMDKNLVLALVFGMFVFAFIGLYMGLRFVHHKTIVNVSTGYEKFRFKRFWFAFFIWAVLLCITVGVGYLVDPDDMTFVLDVPKMLISVLIMAILMPFQTGIEELLFRGYLLQGLSQAFRGALIPLVITSLIFGFLHMGNPEAKEFGWEIMLPYYAGFGLFLGVLTLLDEGLELAFGIHLANNFVTSFWVTSPHSVIQTHSVFEITKEEPLKEFITWLVLATITFVIMWYKYRWKNFKLILK